MNLFLLESDLSLPSSPPLQEQVSSFSQDLMALCHVKSSAHQKEGKILLMTHETQ